MTVTYEKAYQLASKVRLPGATEEEARTAAVMAIQMLFELNMLPPPESRTVELEAIPPIEEPRMNSEELKEAAEHAIETIVFELALASKDDGHPSFWARDFILSMACLNEKVNNPADQVVFRKMVGKALDGKKDQGVLIAKPGSGYGLAGAGSSVVNRSAEKRSTELPVSAKGASYYYVVETEVGKAIFDLGIGSVKVVSAPSVVRRLIDRGDLSPADEVKATVLARSLFNGEVDRGKLDSRLGRNGGYCLASKSNVT